MKLGKLILYPVKSLDGWSVEEAEVTALGTLRHDREWALADLAGNFLNAKRDPRLHQIRATYSESLSEITLALPTRPPTTFSMQDTPALERWFTEFFEKEVRWIQDTDHGFPDDLEANGPTVISEASLRVVGEWFGLDLEESRRRFRTNLELTDAPAFWEDRCYGAAGEAVEVQIGKLRLLGSNPCQRCAVPSRNSQTGDPTPGFQKEFMRRRREQLPTWAEISRFDHFYRLAVNTRIAPGQVGVRIRVGDPVIFPGLKF